MKNIYDILKEFELEVPEDKKAGFDKAWKENYRTKAEYEKAVSQRDEYKTSLNTVNAKLKEFDGVDVADLKGQIVAPLAGAWIEIYRRCKRNNQIIVYSTKH